MENMLPFVRETGATLKPTPTHGLGSMYSGRREAGLEKSRGAGLESATDLHNLLEKNARQLGTEIRILEQQRQYLRSIEKQRGFIYEELAAAMDALRESSQAVNEALSDADPISDMNAHFDSNREALDVLENVSVALVTNFQMWRSAWEQYAGTCERTKDLKAEMSATEPLIDA